MLFSGPAILLLGAQGSRGGDVELPDLSGNSAMQTTKSPIHLQRFKYSTATVTVNCF
jgi:hypothetical protein